MNLSAAISNYRFIVTITIWTMLTCKSEISDTRTTSPIQPLDISKNQNDVDVIDEGLPDEKGKKPFLDRDSTIPPEFTISVKKVNLDFLWPEISGNTTLVTADHVLSWTKDTIYQIGFDDIESREWPSFFGQEFELFYKIPIVSENDDMAAWFFYDSSASPSHEKAIPIYVYDSYQNIRLSTAEHWVMPDKESIKLLFADDQVIWLEDKDQFFLVKRSAATFLLHRWAKDTMSLGMQITSIQKNSLTFLGSDQTIGYLKIAGSELTYQEEHISIEFSPTIANFFPFHGLDILFYAGKISIREQSKKIWHSIIDHSIKPEFLAELEGKVSLIFANQARFLINKNLINLQLDYLVEENTDEEMQGIPELVSSITSIACDGCHRVRAEDNDYQNKALFDHHSIDHWLYFVATSPNPESVILDDMCQRGGGNSPCSQNPINSDVLRKFLNSLQGKSN